MRGAGAGRATRGGRAAGVFVTTGALAAPPPDGTFLQSGIFIRAASARCVQHGCPFLRTSQELVWRLKNEPPIAEPARPARKFIEASSAVTTID